MKNVYGFISLTKTTNAKHFSQKTKTESQSAKINTWLVRVECR